METKLFFKNEAKQQPQKPMAQMRNQFSFFSTCGHLINVTCHWQVINAFATKRVVVAVMHVRIVVYSKLVVNSLIQ